MVGRSVKHPLLNHASIGQVAITYLTIFLMSDLELTALLLAINGSGIGQIGSFRRSIVLRASCKH